MASNTITTTVTVGVELGGPTYGSDLTITATGAVKPGGTLGTTAIYGSPGTLLNNGSIIGGAGTVAGDGVSLSLSAIINARTITGGVGATAGTGVRLIGGTLTNSGDIIGSVGSHGVGDALRATLAERGAKANIKPMRHRVNMPKFNNRLYKKRNLVERFSTN